MASVGYWQHESAIIDEGATIGEGTKIGRYAFIGAGAVINKNVPDYALMVRVPAHQIGWMSEYGEQLSLPLVGEAEVACPYTGAQYQPKHGVLKRL